VEPLPGQVSAARAFVDRVSYNPRLMKASSGVVVFMVVWMVSVEKR
jgi:hypothetical protein